MAGSPAPSERRPLRRRSVLERTLADLGRSLEHSLFAEDIARSPGLLQAVDSRVKVVSLLVLLLATSLTRSPWGIAALYLLALVLARASAVPLGSFIRRVWLVLAFFTGVIALPALFLTPGPPLLIIAGRLAITRTGALTALLLMLRVSTSVSLTLLLVLTTPWNSLLKALGVLHVPDGFTLILGMAYRYLQLLLHTATDMLLSRQSRVLRRLSSAEERQVLAGSAATLLGKSLHLSGEVYLAMQARGYSGHPRTLEGTRVGWRGALLAVVVLALAAALVWFTH